MIPTSSESPVEGHPYRNYTYDPVPTSPTPERQSPTTLLQDNTDKKNDARAKEIEAEGEEEESEAKEKENCRYYSRASQTVTRETLELQDMAEEGSKFLQFVAASAANLAIVTCGSVLAWTSPIAPKLKAVPVAEDNPIGRPITVDEDSWIAGCLSLGAIAGSFIGGYLGEKLGRKRTILISAVPFIIAWIMVATAKDVPQLYAARFIFGCALAMDFTVVPMYCGEIAETSIRGTLGSFLQLFITFGLLFSYIIGPYVTYNVLWIASLCIPVVFILAFMTMPESPYYLLSKGYRDEAIDALARLRSKSKSAVQKEADEMQEVIDEAFKNKAKLSDLFTVKSNFKALVLTCALVSFQQLTGINVVLMFTQDIFKDAGSSIPPEIATIVVGCMQLLASGVTPIVVDRLGRRFLLVASGVGTALTTGSLGLFFFLKYYIYADVSVISWLPVLSLAVFISLYSIGWGPLPWAVMGEMFAPEVKAKASGITVCICWLLSFLITKFFSNVKEAFGSYTVFWLFCICCILSIVFTIFILPETKGKSLQEIQDELNGVKPHQRNGKETIAGKY